MIIAIVVMLWSTAVGVAQVPARHAITEVSQKAAVSAAPRECLVAFRDLFRYLQSNEPDIVRDEPAQKKFLSEYLRKILAEHVATFTSPADDPDYPSNTTFIGSWDQPTTYAIVASRRYGKRAIIDVRYKWGPKTNYPGDERFTSFVFMLEDGRWKLDDYYIYRGEFATAESLNQYLRTKR